MTSVSNVIYLKQYKIRKKFDHLKKAVLSKDTLSIALMILPIVILTAVCVIISYYGDSSYYPSLDADVYRMYLK